MPKWEFQIISGCTQGEIVKIEADKYSEALKEFAKKYGKNYLEDLTSLEKNASTNTINQEPIIDLDISVNYKFNNKETGYGIYSAEGYNLNELIKKIPLKEILEKVNKKIQQGPSEDMKDLMKNKPTLFVTTLTEITLEQLQELVKEGETK